MEITIRHEPDGSMMVFLNGRELCHLAPSTLHQQSLQPLTRLLHQTPSMENAMAVGKVLDALCSWQPSKGHPLSRWAALQVVDLWPAPPVVVSYLETGEDLENAKNEAYAMWSSIAGWGDGRPAGQSALRSALACCLGHFDDALGYARAAKAIAAQSAHAGRSEAFAQLRRFLEMSDVRL